DGDGEPGRREQATRPAPPEVDEIDRAGAGLLVEEERGDEEPRQGEEAGDAEKAPARPCVAAVEAQDGEHEDGTETVERRLVPEGRLGRGEWQHSGEGGPRPCGAVLPCSGDVHSRGRSRRGVRRLYRGAP